MKTVIQNPKSKIYNANSIAKAAQRYLVGGVNSPVRAFRQVQSQPLIVNRSHRATIVSREGTRFVDFIMGWGALMLGHGHPAVMRALARGMKDGVLMGLTHPAEIELARLITDAVPSVEQVRFTVSGTEACMTAVKLARAHTARSKILVFEGCYHGHGESVIAHHSAGIPELLARETITVPFNDLEAFEAALRRDGERLAAIIVEPVAANMGVVPPATAWLTRIRELTRQHGIVLIFDEVVTGFRLGPSGAQGHYGVQPDLTTFGKIIGGGLPIGAVGGPRRLMQRLAPVGDVYHGGTFAGHPLSMAAGVATLRQLASHPPYDALERLATRLAGGLRAMAQRRAVPMQVNQIGSMLTLFFSDGPVTNASQAARTHRERFAQWARALRDRGVLVPPSPLEALFLSTAHTVTHIDRLLVSSDAACAAMVRALRAGQ